MDVILPKLAIPLAVLVGSGITAGTTYALVARVQHLIATAAVSSDQTVWMAEARAKAYEPCYLGCSDCGDPSYAFNGCLKTSTAGVAGVLCDGNLMWNWRDSDRYPPECLRALGQQYQADALNSLKQSYRNQLAIITLTVLGGVAGGFLVWWAWRRWMRNRARKHAVEDAPPPPQSWRSWPRPVTMPTWRRRAPAERAVPEEEEEGGAEPSSTTETTTPAPTEKTRRTGGGKFSRLKLLFTGGLALSGAGKASAYACTGYDPVYDQYFVNANRTIFGVVHGWFSNCWDERVCVQSCSTRCSSTSSGGQSCSTTCTPNCWYVTHSNRAPIQYVNDVLPKVTKCGFQLANSVPGTAGVRVANADIERTWWVKISVNGYNITDPSVTDEMVFCLHDI